MINNVYYIVLKFKMKIMLIKFIVFICTISYCMIWPYGVPIRDFIVNGTSAQLIPITSSMTTGNSVNVSIPLTYSTGNGTLYTGTQLYTGYSFGSVKKVSNYMNIFNIICGTWSYIFGPAFGFQNVYTPGAACYSFDNTCSTFNARDIAPNIESIYRSDLTSMDNYVSIAPRLFYSSKFKDGIIKPCPFTDQYGLFVSIGVGLSPSYAQIAWITNVKNTASSGLGFVNTQEIALGQPFSSGSIFIPPQTYIDYDVEVNNFTHVYLPITTSIFLAQSISCGGAGCSSVNNVQISGYFLLNHYSYADGLDIPVPIFVLSNSTMLILATATNGDLTLSSGLNILTAAPIVGCIPDQGTMINWNNTANPYANTVHLYTMCNSVVEANSTAASSAVYEIAYTNTTLTFTRQKALPNLYTAIDLQPIGEYGQILTTTDAQGTNPTSLTPGLYSLYDPYNPVYIGYATLSNSTSINPVNSVNGPFFSIGGDMTRSGVCSSSTKTFYSTSQNFNGMNIATLNFCGGGNSQYNNASYCDGPGVCCGDFCQYVPTGTTCPNTTFSTCQTGTCQSGNTNCVFTAITNSSLCLNCSSLYPCANYTQSISNSCVPFGLKPAGYPCASQMISIGGMCAYGGGFCDGISNQCVNTNNTDGLPCWISISALCNATGTCLTGSCNIQKPCGNIPPTPINVVSFSDTNSLSAPSSVVGFSAGFIGAFIVVIFVFVFLLVFLISRRRKEDEDEQEKKT